MHRRVTHGNWPRDPVNPEDPDLCFMTSVGFWAFPVVVAVYAALAGQWLWRKSAKLWSEAHGRRSAIN